MTSIIAAALLAINAPSDGGPIGRIEGIEVRLFDTAEGAFGENVLDKSGHWAGWNTFMVEGNAGYGRGDALVLVRIAPKHPGNGYSYVEGTLTVSAMRRGKLLAQRRFKAIGLPNANPAAQALYLTDIGCSGKVEIKAAYEGQVVQARLDFECGE
jgi:hypothetical protein